MSLASDKVVIGKIGASYGVKGWVKINSYTDVPEGIFDYSPWILADGKEYQIDQWRPHGKALVAKLEGIDTRDDAERIKNLDIAIQAEQLPELEEGEYYWRELTGMQVVTTQGYYLGTVAEVFNTGANDVLRIRAKGNDAFGQKERLVPFVLDSVVQTVDKVERIITVDWEPGF